MGRSALSVVVFVVACTTSETDDAATTLASASTGASPDAGTTADTNVTTPTTSISESDTAPPSDDSSSSSSSSTTDAGSDATSLDTTSSSSGTGTTGLVCVDQPTNGDYTECVNGFFCAGGGSCLADEAQTFQVCTRGCFDVCNCWPTPDGDHTATTACRDDILASGDLTCVLDCAAGETCPTGMECHAQFDICVFVPGGESSSSSGSDSGSSTTM